MLGKMQYASSHVVNLEARPNLRDQRGFTLAEILVVMMLIGVIVAVGLPNMLRASIRADMIGEVNQLTQAVAVARINAVKNRQQVVLGFQGNPFTSSSTGGTLRAWVDTNANEVFDIGEEVLREWFVDDDVELRLDASDPLRLLNSPSGSERGVVVRPDGVTLATTGANPVGAGIFTVEDIHENLIRVVVFSGAGSVVTEMKVPDSSVWDSNLRHWRY